MSRGVLVFVVLIAVVGCSTRSLVVTPEEVSKLNDAQWTITSQPRP
jgi:hypothetical protein